MCSPFSEMDLRCFKMDTSHLFAFSAGLCKKDGLAAQGAESFCSVTLPDQLESPLGRVKALPLWCADLIFYESTHKSGNYIIFR